MFRRQRVGIDLGAAWVRISHQGAVLREPSVVALSSTGEAVAGGRSALRAFERAPETLTLAWPLRDGLITEHPSVGDLLSALLSEAKLGRSPDVALSLSCGATDADTQAASRALGAVAHEVVLVEAPLAAALGAGIDVADPIGSMVVNLGARSADVAVVGRGVVAVESIRSAGDMFDEAIVRLLRQKGLLIGSRQAEEIKLEVGVATLNPTDSEQAGNSARTKAVRGRDQTTGAPKVAQVTAQEIAEALHDPLRKVAGGVRRVLEAVPPATAAAVVERGLVLAGGSAQLRNVSDLLQQQTGLPVTVADDPADCVIRGLALTDLHSKSV